jgi:hypothetical protein
VFGKLGIHRRHELAGALAGSGSDAVQTRPQPSPRASTAGSPLLGGSVTRST